MIENIKEYIVPTGKIYTAKTKRGNIEFLSIGDYGKENNIKADFLGLVKEINGVRHQKMLPLSQKWVITISTQYGCKMGCAFCDVPKVGYKGNISTKDLLAQVNYAINDHPEIAFAERLNLHYARMGEPTWNKSVLLATYYLSDKLKSKGWGFHPVVSTMMPKNNGNLKIFLKEWLDIKNSLNGEAGLQLSINTTNEYVRAITMPNAMGLESISKIMNDLIGDIKIVKGRKITLNFALTQSEIDAKKLKSLFDPKYFLCKITPMHNTNAVIKNNLITDNGYEYYYPYKDVEQNLKKQGFDVIVFIPSKEEDASKITCGNALLAEKRGN